MKIEYSCFECEYCDCFPHFVKCMLDNELIDPEEACDRFKLAEKKEDL